MKLLKNIGLSLCAMALAFGLCGCGAVTGTLIAKDELTSEFLGKITTAIENTETYHQGGVENEGTYTIVSSYTVLTEDSEVSAKGSMSFKQAGEGNDYKSFMQVEGNMSMKTANGSNNANASYKVYVGKSGEKFYAIEQVSNRFAKCDTIGDAESQASNLIGDEILAFVSLSNDPFDAFDNLDELDKDTELKVYDLGNSEGFRVVVETTEYGEDEAADEATEKTITSATLIINTIGEGDNAELMVTSVEVKSERSERTAKTGEGETGFTNWTLTNKGNVKVTFSYDAPSITLPSTTDYKEIELT